MKLDNRTIRLIAVGSSITANCQPCLEINVNKAREAGASEQEILEAIDVGKLVRKGAASKMDAFLLNLDHTTSSLELDSHKGGGCDCQPEAMNAGGHHV
jgi:AhpD family alkylhydroperoxidase